MARPTISLQAAIGPGTAATNLFIIGTSLIGGTDVLAGLEVVGQGSWEEIGDRCYSVSTRRGRQRQLEQYKAGTLAANLDNSDGALDPTWTAGPYTDSGVSRVREMAGIYLSANYEGVDYDLYTGFADSWKPTYEYPEGGRVALAATDAFKIFTELDLVEQAAIGAGEATGARLTRILDVIDWPVALRDLDTGNATHQETTLAGTAAAQMRIAVDSERGDLYINVNGKVSFRERLSRYTSANSLIPQWDIGDGATDMNPSAVDPIVSGEIVYNDVNVSRVGGTLVSRQDPAVTPYPYLWKSYNRTDLTLDDDVQVADYADHVLLHHKGKGEPRIRSVSFDPDGYDDLWPMVLGARFGDRVTVELTHPFTGIVFTGDYFIEGVDHDIPVLESGGRWRTTFHLDDASTYPTNPFIIGTSLIGGTDVLV